MGQRGFASFTFPSIQSDVMMIPAGRKEGRTIPHARRDLKPEYFRIESHCPLKVRNLQMDMANGSFGMHGFIL
jgi:hypothetical protein